MPDVIDTNHITTPKLGALKAAGVRTIIRYINPINTKDEKTVKAAEARAIAAAGMKLGLVCEGWGGTGPQGLGHSISADAGQRDAMVCRTYAPTIGAPAGACIYFAVDTDVSNDQVQRYVIPYFQQIWRILKDQNRAGPVYRVGVYGPGVVCKIVKASALCDLTWLSNAMGWNGSRPYRDSNEWDLLQALPKDIAGIDTDPDTIGRSGDIGDFVPFAGAIDVQPELSPTAKIQDDLNKVLALNPPLQTDGIIGPKSLAAIRLLLDRALSAPNAQQFATQQAASAFTPGRDERNANAGLQQGDPSSSVG